MIDQQASCSVKSIVVDDECHVRRRIIDLLSQHSDVELVGECSNGVEAVEMISERRPDLVFLDIQMPKLDGFDVLHSLKSDLTPVVVFVTAFDQHAIKAFDVNAVDYLLKPIDEQRFATAISRSVQRIRGLKTGSAESNTSPNLPVGPCRRLLVRKQDRHIVVNVQEIDWVEAANKHVRLHTESETHICRMTMRDLEQKLDRHEFVRIHRSIIVRLNAVTELQPHFHGDYRVLIHDGTALPLARSYKEAFLQRFQSGA